MQRTSAPGREGVDKQNAGHHLPLQTAVCQPRQCHTKAIHSIHCNKISSKYRRQLHRGQPRLHNLGRNPYDCGEASAKNQLCNQASQNQRRAWDHARHASNDTQTHINDSPLNAHAKHHMRGQQLTRKQLEVTSKTLTVDKDRSLQECIRSETSTSETNWQDYG